MHSNNHQTKETLYKRAAILALITIVYNIIEGIVSVFFGLEDATIALFGFGLDSFLEVISGIGIWHMIGRLKRNNDNPVRIYLNNSPLELPEQHSTFLPLGWLERLE